MRREELNDVPRDEVRNVVDGFIRNDNATRVVCDAQSDGKWTVTADLPD